MNKQLQKKEGFTIIEVVLVLAIVGLIMLMIFIAWPALQRSQRDGARKNDANTVAAAIGSYRGNHNGQNPGGFGDLQPYLDHLSQYDVSNQGISVGDGTGGTPTFNQMIVRTSAKCNSDNTGLDGGSKRQAAILVLLESGGANGVKFCQNA